MRTLTWFHRAVIPGYGRVVGVTPETVFVFVRVSAVVLLLASQQHAPLATGQTQHNQ